MTADDATLADLDLSLLDIQQHLIRIIVLVSSVMVLQALAFLFLAWMADGFVMTAVIGVIGTLVSLIGLLIWIGNFRAYGTMTLTIDEAKANHPAVRESDDSDSS